MPTDREPATVACAFGDLACPCQDGDVCHYVDDPLSETLAMTPPTTTACPRCGKHHVLPCDPAEQRDPLWVDDAIALYGINEARRARAKEASGG